jgi:hypothetical protein
MIEIFFSYAHADEALMDEVRRQLIIHERNGRIVKWHDRQIPPGDEWRTHIDHRLNRAQVILLFVSPHFIESKYCYEIEGRRALTRHTQGSARVVPIILRPCAWHDAPFSKLQALPRDGRPISQWEDIDVASLDAATGVMKVVDEIVGVGHAKTIKTHKMSAATRVMKKSKTARASSKKRLGKPVKLASRGQKKAKSQRRSRSRRSTKR